VKGSVSVVLCNTSRGAKFEVSSMGLASLINLANSFRSASTSAKVGSVLFLGFAEVTGSCVETGTECVPRDALVPVAIGISARAWGGESAGFTERPERGGTDSKTTSESVSVAGVSFKRGGDETGRSSSDVRDCGGELGVTAG
jgi:hypothetical protein